MAELVANRRGSRQVAGGLAFVGLALWIIAERPSRF